MNRFGTPLVKLPGEAVWSVSIPLSSPLGLNAMSGSDLQKSISTRLSVWRGVSSHVVKARADWDLTWKKRYASRSCRFNIEINDKTQQETNFLLLISAVIEELKYQCGWGVVVVQGCDGIRRGGHRDRRRRFVKGENTSVATGWSRDEQVELNPLFQPRKNDYKSVLKSQTNSHQEWFSI